MSGVQTAAQVAPPDSPRRTFDPESRLFRSPAEPRIAVRIAPGFTYLGHLEFPLEQTAWVDRHLFASLDGSRVRSLIVFQFEGFLPQAEGQYRFSIPGPGGRAGGDYRYSPAPIELAGREYVHNTWAFDQVAGARANPGRESARTLRFLESKGLELESELIMSRFARAVGWEARRELILFYLEPLSTSGHTLADFPGGSGPTHRYDELSAAVTARSLEAFRAVDYPRIDTNHSTLGFEVPIVRGISKVTGKFEHYEVDLVHDRDTPEASSVAIRIDASSVDTGIDQRDEHLTTADFFAVEQHPQIAFESRRVEPTETGFVVSGVLSLRGVEKSVRVPVAVADYREAGDVWTAYSARWTLDRTEFGIDWSHSAIPFFVGDEITVDLVFVTR